jgi:hypothetical protein
LISLLLPVVVVVVFKMVAAAVRVVTEQAQAHLVEVLRLNLH